MIRQRLVAWWLVPLVLLPLASGPAPAGVFFKRNKKPAPTDRVPELLAIVKTDGDESKRAAAAQELRQYDPAQYPMVVPVLIDVLMHDAKPAVRAEAAQSLGKMRPISQQAGMALEQALNNDASMRVRLQARSSLLQYHWGGYHGTRKDELVPQTKEPPLADAPMPMPPPVITTAPMPAGGRLTPRPADGSQSTSSYHPTAPAPFPFVPARPTVVEPPLAPAPAPAPPVRGGDAGPELSP